MRILSAALVLLLACTAARADIDPALREDGVLYFEDDLPQKIVATVKTPTTIYLRRDFQSPLALMSPGTTLELIGMNSQGYLVKGDYRNNTVTGWILPADLPPGIDPALIAQAKKTQERHDLMAGAIAHKDVIEGMTPDEVVQSVGQPDQQSSHIDGAGTTMIWIFTTYADVLETTYAPGPFGRPIPQTYPVKEPVGRLIVSFTNGVVVSIQQNKTDPGAPGIITN